VAVQAPAALVHGGAQPGSQSTGGVSVVTANSVNASALRWAALRWSSAALGRARGCRAVSRVSPGCWVQQAVDGDHARKGGGHPQPVAVVASQGLLLSSSGVGDLDQVPDDLAQPGWVHLWIPSADGGG
jgi:hypothetical protein